MRYKVFISSVQLEFASERLKLSEYLQNDALFRRFFDVFIFESIPAQDRTAFNVYIEEVKQCDIFITLLGKKVGFEFEDGSFPTQQEFETATKYNKYRLVFLLNVNENDRHKKINLLIKKVSEDLIYESTVISQ